MKILIVDDRSVVRKELRNILELTGMVDVVGEAADGWQALHQASVLHPDIVLMDLEMPGMDGFEATRRIKAQHLARVVIVCSVYGDLSSQKEAAASGADAFIVKGTDLQTMMNIFEQSIQNLDF